jgi:O-antigen/teichoic acid export membrane protein
MSNALHGVGEYIAQPAAMLLAARFLLPRMGLSQYGLWMLAAAMISSGSLISSGFGDATLKYVAMYRSRENRNEMEEVLRVNLTINLTLSSFLAAMIWCATPVVVDTWFKIDPSLKAAAIIAFRVGAMVLVVRSAESVFSGALRAHERYGPSVQISVLSRIAVIASACILAAKGHGIVAIMWATLGIFAASAIMHVAAAWLIIGPMFLLPALGTRTLSKVFAFGCFSWLQAVAGCIFNQADRLLIGLLLGTSAVASYSLCVQAAQPIHGVIAAGLHFVFPHLSARLSTTQVAELKTVVRPILRLNIVLAIIFCAPLVFFSKQLLSLWIGPAFAKQSWVVLTIIATGFGVLALNITGHYALLALGKVKTVALLNLAGGATMLLAMTVLGSRFGLVGVALGRLMYGSITVLMYRRLKPILSTAYVARSHSAGLLGAGELDPLEVHAHN